MKSAASCVRQCELQDTSIIGISNAHCGLGSSRGRARLRVVIRRPSSLERALVGAARDALGRCRPRVGLVLKRTTGALAPEGSARPGPDDA